VRPHAAAEAILRHALSLPGTHEDHPWGEVVAKVQGKVFVFFGRRAEPVLRVSLKLPASGERWLDQEFAEPSAYGMGPHGWVTFTFDSGNVLAERELCALVDESYRAVAPKKLLKALDAGGEPPQAEVVRKPRKPAPRRRKKASAARARRRPQ
jgi:predicted DNA-binding protein (MmcQ/YjbR family)